MDEIVQSDWDVQVNVNWKRIDLDNLIVLHQGVVLNQHAFYFRMIYKTVNSLIDTGIMKHLVDNHLRRKRAIKIEESTKVLGLKELAFGFNIWLGFCFLSLVAFIMEMIIYSRRKAKTLKKIKFSKVYPTKVRKDFDVSCMILMNSKLKVYERFKIRKKNSTSQKFDQATNSEFNDIEIFLNVASECREDELDDLTNSIRGKSIKVKGKLKGMSRIVVIISEN